MNTTTSYILFSVDRNNTTNQENTRARRIVEQVFKSNGTAFKRCNGVYNGDTEQSYMVAWTPENEDLIQMITYSFQQDCYLIVDANGYGWLIEPNGSFKDGLGKARVRGVQPDTDHTGLMDENYLTFG